MVAMRNFVKTPHPTMLIQRQAGTTRLGVVQYRGGDLAITSDDEILAVRRWGAGEVEACIKVFLRLAHDRDNGPDE